MTCRQRCIAYLGAHEVTGQGSGVTNIVRTQKLSEVLTPSPLNANLRFSLNPPLCAYSLYGRPLTALSNEKSALFDETDGLYSKFGPILITVAR